MAGHRVHARAPAALRLAPHALLVAFCGGLLAAVGAGAPVAGAAGGAVAAALAAGGCALRGRAGAALALLGAAVALAGWAWGTVRLRFASSHSWPCRQPARKARRSSASSFAGQSLIGRASLAAWRPSSAIASSASTCSG
jgi:hypothetical protein